MVKAERMVRMLGYIYEQPGELAVRDLAKICSISERAIFRDLHTLHLAGVRIKLNGRGYRVMNMESWRDVFEQKNIADAVVELITRGLKQCKDDKLIKQGEAALKLLKTSRA